MERELFDFVGGWDGDPECMVYYNVRLAKDIGQWPRGTEFFSAAIKQDDGHGVLEFHNNDDSEKPIARYSLHYEVRNTLPIE